MKLSCDRKIVLSNDVMVFLLYVTVFVEINRKLYFRWFPRKISIYSKSKVKFPKVIFMEMIWTFFNSV